MNVGIIGAGNVGGALARGAVRAGHQVWISSREIEDAKRVASESGASVAESNREAAQNANVIILAVPFDAMTGIIDELGADVNGRVLVDVSNRFDPAQLSGESNAERLQRHAGGAKVVKAFNTVFAAHQADPVVDGVPLDGFVAADDAQAKRDILELVESLGYRPIDAGGLAISRALEGLGLLNISLNMQHGWPWQSAWKLLGPSGEVATRKAA